MPHVGCLAIDGSVMDIVMQKCPIIRNLYETMPILLLSFQKKEAY